MALQAGRVGVAQDQVDSYGKVKSGGGGQYVLPPATANNLGGVKVGNGLSVESDGTLSADTYTLPPATANDLGGVKVGNGLSVDADGVLSSSGGATGFGDRITAQGDYAGMIRFNNQVINKTFNKDGFLIIRTSNATSNSDTSWTLELGTNYWTYGSGSVCLMNFHIDSGNRSNVHIFPIKAGETVGFYRLSGDGDLFYGFLELHP